MYNRILVPLDGSLLAEGVLPYVHILGGQLQSRVQLLRVADPALSYVNYSGDFDTYYVPVDHEEEAQIYLETTAEPLRKDGMAVSTAVHHGISPAECILGEAARDPSTLIAMSTHGRSGLSRWLIGSVTDKVLQAARNPLFIVRARVEGTFGAETGFNQVIVPLDGSLMAEKVLPHVVELSKSLGVAAILVRAIPTEESYSRYLQYSVGAFENFSLAPETRAEDYLKGVADKLVQHGVSCVEQSLLYGDPAKVILGFASRTSSSLVALTTHGRAGVSRWVLGSVTDRVVRHSEFPVLVIPGIKGDSTGD